MSKIEVNEIAARTGTNVSVASGHVIKQTGMILQCVAMHLTTRTTMNHGSNSTVDFHNVNITPKAAGSTFLLQGTYPIGTSDDEGGGIQNNYYFGVYQRSVAGNTHANCDNLGTSSQGGYSAHIELAPNRTGDNSTVDYLSGRRYRCEHKSTQFFDTPSYTLGNTINYKLTVTHKGGGSYIQFGEPPGHSSDDNYQLQPYGTTIWEVAQ